MNVRGKESVIGMNIQGNINKLLMAISIKGKEVKIRTDTFFSEEKMSYMTKYQFMERKEIENAEGEMTKKWVEINSCYGKVKLLKTLVDYFNEIEGEANEERTTD